MWFLYLFLFKFGIIIFKLSNLLLKVQVFYVNLPKLMNKLYFVLLIPLCKFLSFLQVQAQALYQIGLLLTITIIKEMRLRRGDNQAFPSVGLASSQFLDRFRVMLHGGSSKAAITLK